MEKNWIVAERKYDDVIDQLLYNRGVFGEKEKRAFLHPDFSTDTHDPFLLSGMKKAIERIVKAQENGETIGIFADYDADGIPGAALLHRALKQIGIISHTFIPNREGGYGLSEDGIKYLMAQKCSLIITVDLGIRNFKEAEYCKRNKLDLIITDHHEPDVEIPDAYAVINPKKKGEKYPYKDLAGCGVVFKMVQALGTVYPKKLDIGFIKWNLDLAAISTIADVVKLNGENRVIAKYGLIVIQKTKNLGLSELIKISSLTPDKINTYSVGFQIAPRINAPGRIDHAAKSFELLVTDVAGEARELAIDLDSKNMTRQEQMEKVYNEAILQIEKSKQAEDLIVIVAGDWPKGVIGPVASRISEKFVRPAILFSTGSEHYTGSARSLPGINIVALLDLCKKELVRFGGHKGAAGLTLKNTNYKKFSKKIKEESARIINPEMLKKKISVDIEMKGPEISTTLCKDISTLEPFGLGNQRPIFLMKEVVLSAVRWIGKENNHAQFNIEKDGKVLKGIYFKATNCDSKIESSKSYDIVFSLELDEWQGRHEVKLHINDMKENEK